MTYWAQSLRQCTAKLTCVDNHKIKNKKASVHKSHCYLYGMLPANYCTRTHPLFAIYKRSVLVTWGNSWLVNLIMMKSLIVCVMFRPFNIYFIHLHAFKLGYKYIMFCSCIKCSLQIHVLHFHICIVLRNCACLTWKSATQNKLIFIITATHMPRCIDLLISSWDTTVQRPDNSCSCWVWFLWATDRSICRMMHIHLSVLSGKNFKTENYKNYLKKTETQSYDDKNTDSLSICCSCVMNHFAIVSSQTWWVPVLLNHHDPITAHWTRALSTLSWVSAWLFFCLAGLVVGCPPLQQEIWGSVTALSGQVISVTWTLVLLGLPRQAPGVLGWELGLVNLVSVYCDWVRQHAWSATPILLWQHVKIVLADLSLRCTMHAVGTLSNQETRTKATDLFCCTYSQPVMWG